MSTFLASGHLFVIDRHFGPSRPGLTGLLLFNEDSVFLKIQKKVLVSSEKGQSVSCDLEKFNQLPLPFLIEHFL